MIPRSSEIMGNLWIRSIRNITAGIYNYICRSPLVFLPLTFACNIMLLPSPFPLSFSPFPRPCLSALSPSDRPHSFPSRYTFDKVTAVHYTGRSFTAVIYDYYYCAVMAAAIAWPPHIEKLFLPQRKRVEHYGTKVAASLTLFPRGNL